MFILVFYGLAIVFTLLRVLFTKRERNRAFVIGTFFKSLLFFVAGILYIYTFMGHTIKADQVAEYIGWPAGNPFQFEVAMTSLTLAFLGILAPWMKDGFKLATVMAGAIFSWGAGVGHIYQIVEYHNYHPGNAGPILYADFISPVILIIFYVLYRRTKKTS